MFAMPSVFDGMEPGMVYFHGATEHSYLFLGWHYVEFEGAINRYMEWGAYCAACFTPITSITSDAPRWLRRFCAPCKAKDAAPRRHGPLDVQLAPPETEEPKGRGVQRLGAIERQIMEVADEKYRTVESVRYDQIVDAVVERMPAPEEGVRDSRRGRVVRALKNLSGKNGLLEIVNGRVIFME